MNYYDNYTFLQKYSAEPGSFASDFQVKGSCEQGDTGGYCTFDKEENDLPIFHYYTQDHLGNNRVVTKDDGTIEQIVHYYPFGGTFNDAGLNTGLQQYFLKSSTFAVLNDNKISPCESRRALHGYLSHWRRYKDIPTLLRY